MKRFILLMLLLTTPAAYASEYVNGVLVGPTSLTDPSGTTAVSVDSSGYTHITPAVTVGVSYTSSTPPTNGAIIQGKTSIGSDLTPTAQLGITAAASTNPFSATTATGDNVYVDTSGDVHIQSTTPTSATLYVKGNAASTGFYIQSDVNKDAYVWQAENRGMYIGTNNSTRMSLDSSGNVGIGTASPSAPLTVIGYSRTGSTSDGVQLSTEAGFGRIIGIDIDGSAYNGLKFFASATEAVTIDTSGNVKVEGGTFDTNITSTGDLYTGAAGAVDYSTTTINGTTCDITGGSGGSGGVIVKRIGKTVFVEYYIIFTESNSTNVTFTIPYTPQATPGGFSHYVHGSFAREGATYLANPPTCSFASTGKTVTCYKNGNDGVFATSGLKFVSGQFFYETSE